MSFIILDKRNCMERDELLSKYKMILQIQRYSEKSIKTYCGCLSYFLSVSSKYSTESISHEQLEKFIIWLIQKKKIGHSYQKAMLATIVKFYKEIYNRNIDLKHLYPKRKKTQLPKFLSKDEIRRLFKATENIKHKAILVTIYSCGLRLNELLELKMEDIKTKDGILIVRQGKGNKDRLVNLPLKLIQLLREYYSKYRPKVYLFEGQNGGKYSERSVQQIMKNSLTAAKIISPASVHTLRHSYATHLLENGTDIRIIKELLGHNNIKTTEIYTHITDIIKQHVTSPLDLL